jgi:hypothetical protein
MRAGSRCAKAPAGSISKTATCSSQQRIDPWLPRNPTFHSCRRRANIAHSGEKS